MIRNADGSIRGWDPHGVDDLAKPCYDFKGMSGAWDFLRDMNDGLDRLGWGVYQTDHEDANCQYEINFQYADALTTADRLTFFRMMAGQLAQRAGRDRHLHGQAVLDRTGSGAHMHYHLADAETGRNLFRDEADPRGLGLSKLAYHFLGGVLEHAPALCAVTSPTVNCYKRLQIGPALDRLAVGLHLDAGLHHLRRQQPHPDAPHPRGRATSRTARSRARSTPTSASPPTSPPGLDGIARELDPASRTSATSTRPTSRPWPAAASAPCPRACPRPSTISSATAVVRESLGPIADEFLRLKRDEWREYHAQVESWEIEALPDGALSGSDSDGRTTGSRVYLDRAIAETLESEHGLRRFRS